MDASWTISHGISQDSHHVTCGWCQVIHDVLVGSVATDIDDHFISSGQLRYQFVSSNESVSAAELGEVPLCSHGSAVEDSHMESRGGTGRGCNKKLRKKKLQKMHNTCRTRGEKCENQVKMS